MKVLDMRWKERRETSVSRSVVAKELGVLACAKVVVQR